MPLQRQTLPLIFGQGLDTRTDPKQLAPGKMTVLENAVLETQKRISKRNGFETVEELSGGNLLATLKGELLATTGTRAQAFSSQGPVDKGQCEALQLTVQPVCRNTYAQQTPDSAVHPLGVTVFTFESTEAGSVVSRYSVFDTATGQPIVSNVKIGTTAIRPKPLALGNYILIFYYESSTNHVRMLAVQAASPASPLAPVDISLIPDSTAKLFDATVIGGIQGRAYVTQYTNTSKITGVIVTPALVVGAEKQLLTSVSPAPTALTIFGDSDQHVWIAYHQLVLSAPTVWVAAFQFTLTGTAILVATVLDSPSSSVRNITGFSQNGTATVLYECINGSNPSDHLILTNTVTIAGVVGTPSTVARSVGLASKAFLVNGIVHALATHQSALQSTYFLVTVTGGIVAKISPGTGGGLTVRNVLPEVCNPSEDLFSTTYLQADQLSSAGGNVFTQAGVQQASFDFTAAQQATELSDNLHVTGGLLWMYDGVQTVEHGFHLFPENIAATVSGTGLTGQYQYVVVWEWMDNFGCVHRSAPSVPLTLTPSNQGYQLTIPTLRLTAKSTPISVVVYRTQANQSIFYRLTSISSPLLNDATVDSVTYTDNASDSSIIGNEQLYTEGGQLENIAPPAPKIITNYRGRLFLVPAENPYSFWFSQQMVQGVPVQFNDALFGTIDQLGGELTMLHEMDDKIIFFKAARVFAMVGNGPAADGSNTDYQPPTRIEVDAGCTDPNSVVAMPLGLMFKGAKGIYLLDRGLNSTYIGADVEAYNGSTVTSAQHIPTAREVRFTLSTGETLVYNYNSNQWDVSTKVNGASSAIFENRFTYVDPTGIVKQEVPGQFTDDGEPVLLKLTTGWLNLAGLQGFQRIYRLLVLGEYRSAHKLIVSVAYDFDPTPLQRVTIDAGTLLAQPIYGEDVYGEDVPFGGDYPLYQFRLPLLRQKCESIQFTIEEAQSPPFGEGMSLSALAIEVGLKASTYKVKPARTFG